MLRHWEGTQLDEQLRRMMVIIDTREQRNQHIVSWLTAKGVTIIHRKLDYGDYSAQLDDMTFERSFVVERKANLDEICGNLTKERTRLEHEFTKAKLNRTKVFLIIENASLRDAYIGNYRSQYSPKALLASLKAFEVRYNITLKFVEREQSPQEIYDLLWYGVREELLYGRQC